MRFLFSIVLMRLLQPGDYGLMAMVAVYLMLARGICAFGIDSALVQKKELSKDDTATAFWMNLALGVFLATLLAAAAPLLARFYHHSELIGVVLWQVPGVMAVSLGVVPSALLLRRLQLKRLAIAHVVADVVAGTTGIALAFHGVGVWSLVADSVVALVVATLLAWTMARWRPAGHFRVENARSLASFGWGIAGAHALMLVRKNLFTAVMGRLFSAGDVGGYTKADGLVSLPVDAMGGIARKVTLPTLAPQQLNRTALLLGIRRFQRITVFLSAGTLFAIALAADELIPLVFGTQWLSMVPIMKVLALGVVLMPVSALSLVMLDVRGRTERHFGVEVAKVANVVLVLLVLARFGVMALVWGTVYLAIAEYLLNTVASKSEVGYSWGMQAADLLPALLLCLGAASVGLFAGRSVPLGWASFSVKLVAYMACVAAGLFAFSGQFADVRELLRSLVKKE